MSELSIWMPLHIDAWQGSASVQQMTDAEHRAFLNLLMEAWQAEDCGLPSEEKELAKLSRKRAEWPQIREAVLDEFDLIDGRYYNAKLLKERRFADAVRVRRCEAGRAGNNARWAESRARKAAIANGSQTDADAIPADSEGTPEASLSTPTPTPTTTEKTQRRGAPVCSLPEWVPAEAWERFAAMRKANRKPITAHAEGLLVAKLEQLRKEGHDPAGVLDQSTMNGWQGLFAIHVDRQGAGPRPEARVGVAAAPGVAATREMLDKHDELALNYWREMRERGSPRYAKECPASLKRKIEGEKAA